MFLLVCCEWHSKQRGNEWIWCFFLLKLFLYSLIMTLEHKGRSQLTFLLKPRQWSSNLHYNSSWLGFDLWCGSSSTSGNHFYVCMTQMVTLYSWCNYLRSRVKHWIRWGLFWLQKKCIAKVILLHILTLYKNKLDCVLGELYVVYPCKAVLNFELQALQRMFAIFFFLSVTFLKFSTN